jgi:hypothetical protein
MSVEQLLAYAANYGFAMVIALYLLVRIEGKLEALADSINRLTQVLSAK